MHLFGTIRLLIFSKKSHLYVYSHLYFYSFLSNIVRSYSKVTKVYLKILLVKSSENDFIFLPAFYLIMCLMQAPKNSEKIAILKILEQVSSRGSKTHFGKVAK